MTWHQGERAVQHRAGEAQIAGRAGRTIGETIPEIAQAFLAAQPMVVVGSLDPAGRVWSSLLSGPPGFVRAPDERTVVVESDPVAGDPLAAALVGSRVPLAIIAVEPQTRRRMRLNGTAELCDGHLASAPSRCSRTARSTSTPGGWTTSRRHQPPTRPGCAPASG